MTVTLHSENSPFGFGFQTTLSEMVLLPFAGEIQRVLAASSVCDYITLQELNIALFVIFQEDDISSSGIRGILF